MNTVQGSESTEEDIFVQLVGLAFGIRKAWLDYMPGKYIHAFIETVRDIFVQRVKSRFDIQNRLQFRVYQNPGQRVTNVLITMFPVSASVILDDDTLRDLLGLECELPPSNVPKMVVELLVDGRPLLASVCRRSDYEQAQDRFTVMKQDWKFLLPELTFEVVASEL